MSRETLEQSVNRVLVLQLVLVVALIMALLGFFLIYHGSIAGFTQHWRDIRGAIIAAIYGGGLAVVLTMISARSVKKSSKTSVYTPEMAMVPVYAGTVQKLLVAAAGMALGLIQFGLMPIYVVLGYLVVHIAYVLAFLKGDA